LLHVKDGAILGARSRRVNISTFHPEDKCILFCERYSNLKNGGFCLLKNCPNTSQSVVLFRNETEVLKVPKVIESISEYSYNK